MPGSGAASRGTRRMRVLAAAAALATLAFLALGTWQVQRRAWKLELIARVEQRIHAEPAAAPGPAAWAAVQPADEYRRVRLAGRFLPGPATLVQAVTALGPGFWALAPLQADDGSSVLVNRGFVPADQRAAAATQPAGHLEITGLLRISEPGGAFLRRNDPAAGRWYARDVPAIAAARGLGAVAPYFVDAQPAPHADPQAWPRPGLTVTSFRNSHLVYALTWYALAAMSAAAAYHAARDGRRQPRRAGAGEDPGAPRQP